MDDPSSSSTTRKPLKIQPKNVGRRSEAERRRIDLEESARRKARLDAAAAEAAAEEERRRAAYGYMSDSRGGRSGLGGRGGGGDFRGGRGGRGGFMGSGKGDFGGRGDRGGKRDRGGRQDGSLTRVKKEGGLDRDGDVKMEGSSLTAVKQEGGTGGYVPVSSASDDDDDEDEKRRQEGRKNIEYINLSSDEDDEYEDAKSRSMHRSGALMPVRLKRTQHVDRVVGVNTEASSAGAAKIAKQVEAHMEETGAASLEEAMTTTTKQGKARAKDIEFLGGVRKWKGVYDDKDAQTAEVRIKEEPREDDVTMLDVPEVPQDTSAVASDEDGETKPIVKKSPTKHRRKSGLKPARGKGNPAFQTTEERREWEIQQHDLEVLRDELGRVNISTTKANATGTTTTVGGTLTPASASRAEGQQELEEDEDADDQRADNVYIFQLPPILPGLTLPPKPRIKGEDEGEEGGGGGEVAKAEEGDPSDDTTAGVKPPPEDPKEAGATTETMATKEEDVKPARNSKASKAAQVDSDVEEELRRSEARETAIKPKLAPGLAGKLRVYKSGRVTLDWGGASLEVGMGLDAYFLQSAVLTRMDDDKGRGSGSSGGGGFGGEAMSFGQVRGKFVVTPDWEEILG